MQFDMQAEQDGSESESDGDQIMENQITTGVGEGEVNFDNMQKKSLSTSSSSCAENLAFQLFDGEEMNAQMANFIGIHMLSDLTDLQGVLNEENNGVVDEQAEDGEQFMDPETGAHFQYDDLVKRIQKLKKRRAIIDKAIEEEDRIAWQNSQAEQKMQKIKMQKINLTDGDQIDGVTEPDNQSKLIISK